MMYRIRLYGSGVDVPIYKETAFELSDAVYCIHCKTEYEYDYRTYSHLGGFRCPKCGYHRQTPQVGVTQVVRTGADSSDIVLNAFGHSMMCTLIFREVTIFTMRQPVLRLRRLLESMKTQQLMHSADLSVVSDVRNSLNFGKSKARMMLVKNPAVQSGHQPDL